MSALSIIIPSFNEMKNDLFSKSVTEFSKNDRCNLYVVDGGSVDGTLEFLKANNINVVVTTKNSRALRINEGLRIAKHEVVLINHPRSYIDPKGIDYLIENADKFVWGAFTHQFDLNSKVLAFTSWYSNHIRGDLKKIYYLDHCIFLNLKKIKTTIKLPDIDIFEDTALCKMLSKEGRGVRLPYVSTTSAVRFVKNGVLLQSLMNQVLKLGYKLNVSDKIMNKIYEFEINLNSKY
jgi:glycosyltransferase involved in cell wall biosynthesis